MNLGKSKINTVRNNGKVDWLPYSLDIEPTIKCNLKCPMCIHTYWNRRAVDLTVDNFKKILDGIDTLMKIKLQGIGEPLLSKHFFNLID